MKQQQKWYGAFAISAALALSACGGGGGSSSGGGATASSVGGGSALGIIRGGVVNAHRIEDGLIVLGETLAEPTETADDGSWSLTLNSDYVRGEAILIRITASDDIQEPTTMVCDLTVCKRDGSGNPTVEFGDVFEADPSLEVLAVVPGAEGGSLSVNVTALTNLAAALALADSAKGVPASDAARAANFKVSERLGLDTSTPLTEVPVIDITDADAVNDSDDDALEYNLKAAAALQAAVNNANPGTGLERALRNVSEQYAEKGFADKESADSADVTLEELLAEAEVIVDAVESREGVDGAKTASTKSKVQSEKGTAQGGSETPSQGDAPAPSEGGEAARQFVQQIRDIGAVSDAQEAFGDELELGMSVLGRVSGPVMEGMALAAEAIGFAFNAYNDAESTKPTFVEFEGVTVNIAVDGDTVTYSIDQTLNEQSSGDGTVQPQEGLPPIEIVMSAVDDGSSFSETETAGDSTYDYTLDASIDFALTGSVTSDEAMLSINEGSELVLDLLVTEDEECSCNDSPSGDGSESTYTEEGESSFAIEDLSFILDVTLEQLEDKGSEDQVQASATQTQLSGPASFDGSFELEIDLISEDETFTYSETESSNGFSNEEDGTLETRIEGAELTMAGIFAVGERELFGSLGLVLDNVSESCSGGFESGFSDDGFFFNDTLECDEAYQGTVSITFGFGLELDGMSDDVELTFAIAVEGQSNPTLDIDIDHGEGESINLDYVYEEGARNLPTVSNHNGVELSLAYVSDDSDDIEGELTKDGERVGVVNERRGFLAVTYPNGEFESL